MEKNKKNDNKIVWVIGTIIFFVILIIFILNLSESKKELDAAKLEYNLIQEGKAKSSDDIINEIVAILKNRDEEKLTNYLTEDFSYINNSRYESKYINEFWNDLQYLVDSNYDIEKRENSIETEETYFIYWNTNNLVTDRIDNLYCLQKIRIYLRKLIEQDQITYKIYRIILTDN